MEVMEATRKMWGQGSEIELGRRIDKNFGERNEAEDFLSIPNA